MNKDIKSILLKLRPEGEELMNIAGMSLAVAIFFWYIVAISLLSKIIPGIYLVVAGVLGFWCILFVLWRMGKNKKFNEQNSGELNKTILFRWNIATFPFSAVMFLGRGILRFFRQAFAS